MNSFFVREQITIQIVGGNPTPEASHESTASEQLQ